MPVLLPYVAVGAVALLATALARRWLARATRIDPSPGRRHTLVPGAALASVGMTGVARGGPATVGVPAVTTVACALALYVAILAAAALLVRVSEPRAWPDFGRRRGRTCRPTGGQSDVSIGAKKGWKWWAGAP